jgi:ankyrin repeat protein
MEYKKMTTNRNNSIDIFDALWKNKIETVKTYIKNGGDVNARSKYGFTALMLARSVEMAKLLIDAGADINAKDKREGLTVLMWARFGRPSSITRLLESHGAVAVA